jgi:GMP synthase-like glutamine amidotransferase
MNAHYLQHVPFEGLGSIESWLEAAGHKITKTQFYKSANLPEPDQLDLLIVMGGPMSVNDEDALPWLVQEKRFIRDIIRTGKPVLGVCLGAQLIASALGARVYKNAAKEFGGQFTEFQQLNVPDKLVFFALVV